MAKFKMTKLMYDAYKRELELLDESIEDATMRRNDAQKEGDLSENASYTKAKEDLLEYKTRKDKLQRMLNEAEPIDASTSNMIDAGSYVNITECDRHGNSLNQAELFLLDSVEKYLCGVIGVNSPIGKRAVGNPSGLFDVTVNGHTMYYRVDKLQPTMEVETQFKETYPMTLDGIFDV